MFTKIFVEKHVDLLLIREEGKRHYVLIKDFNTFMYDDTLHRGRKYFCCYCLRAFSTDKILKYFVKDSFKMYGKQMIKMPKKDEYVILKNYERKIKFHDGFVKDFNTIMYDDTLHRGRKHFFRYCLQDSSTQKY